MSLDKLIAAASRIRLVVTDVDGVLTDAGVYYSARGEEMKRFSIRDGMGVRRLREVAGIETAIITGELSESVRRRAEKLRISELHLGVESKCETIRAMAARLDIAPERMAYIGDDVNDLSAMALVGLTACPRDAFEEIRNYVGFVCDNKGGHGAFREFAELIISSKAKAHDAGQTGGKA